MGNGKYKISMPRQYRDMMTQMSLYEKTFLDYYELMRWEFWIEHGDNGAVLQTPQAYENEAKAWLNDRSDAPFTLVRIERLNLDVHLWQRCGHHDEMVVLSEKIHKLRQLTKSDVGALIADILWPLYENQSDRQKRQE